LRNNHLGPEGINTLSKVLKSGHLTGLKSLDLSDNKFDDSSVIALSEALKSGNLSNLKSLDLRHNEMYADRLITLSEALQSGNLSGLQSLNLDSNAFKNKGMFALGEALKSGNLPGLQSLNLRHTYFNENGMFALGEVLKSGHLSGLQSLSLDINSKREVYSLAHAINESGLSRQLRITTTNRIKDDRIIYRYELNKLIEINLNNPDCPTSPIVAEVIRPQNSHNNDAHRDRQSITTARKHPKR
ncbi:MAG: hypothetical protein P8144_14925, partial [Gammaproteobacteria bacterium]